MLEPVTAPTPSSLHRLSPHSSPQEEVGRRHSVIDGALPLLFLVEAEPEWARELLREIRARTLSGMEKWESLHPV